MKCDRCSKYRILKGAVLNGKYGQYCRACFVTMSRQADPGFASFSRNRDRSEYEKDMIQPWINGKPNREFIRNYKDKAADYFSQEELETYG